MRGKKTAKKVYTRKIKKTYKKKTGVKKATVKAIVKREIAKNVENKSYSIYTSIQPIYPSVNANFQASVNPVSPFSGYLSILQGTSQGTRIGNEIKLKKLMFSFVLSSNPYNATSNPQPSPTDVILWIFYDKLNPTSIPQLGSDFLQLGGSALPLQNSLIDVTAPVNEDRYRVLYRRTYKVGFSSYGGTGTLADFQSFTNNDYRLNIRKKIDLMPYVIKHIKYNDNNPTPTTRGLFAVFQAIRPAGGSYSSAYVPCSAAVTVDMVYEDA